jgi:hypothetical protein
VGPSSDLNFDYERALVGMALISMRAKWRSSLSACRSVEKNYLTGNGIVRDACWQQLSCEPAGFLSGAGRGAKCTTTIVAQVFATLQFPDTMFRIAEALIWSDTCALLNG